ncbi:hypothetical protein, partial [Bacillus cereus]|uniref:hypothetical protein n=1 Tax=Bacillus cereus TaxID=1396 RepID=UPI0020BFB09F
TLAAQTPFDKLGESEETLVQGTNKLTLFFKYANVSKKVNALNSSVSDYNAQLATLKTAVAALHASGSEYAASLDNIKEKLNEKLTGLTNEASALTDVMSKIESLN